MNTGTVTDSDIDMWTKSGDFLLQFSDEGCKLPCLLGTFLTLVNEIKVLVLYLGFVRHLQFILIVSDVRT